MLITTSRALETRCGGGGSGRGTYQAGRWLARFLIDIHSSAQPSLEITGECQAGHPV